VDPAPCASELAQARAGQTAALRVQARDGRERTAAVTLVEEPSEAATSLVVTRVPELGCEVRSVTPDLGVVVVRVDGDPGGDRLRPGDVVRELNHAPVRSVSELARRADRLRAGEAVALLVQRGQTATYVAFTARRR
jgi:S1-C subfamily serine protease